MSWPKVRLKDICDLQNGYAFKSSDYVDDSNTLSCRMSNIRPGGVFDIDYNARYLPDDFAEKYSQFLLKDGDVIIAMTDLADAPEILGVPTVVETEGRNVLLNQRVGKLVIKDSQRVHFPYLKLALNYPKVRSVYKRFAGGGLQINLGKNDLLCVEIPLPPLGEQKRIAAILDKADAIRRKRQQAIQLADDFLRSVFLDMFGDPVTNPKGWEVKTVIDVSGSKLQNGAYYPKDMYNSAGTEMVHMGDAFYDYVPRGKMKRVLVPDKDLQKYCFTSNDILISRRSLNYEGAAKPSLISESEDNLIFESSLIRLSPDQNIIDRLYLFSYLSNEKVKKHKVRQYVTGATIKGISQKNLEKVNIVLPPLDLQKKYAQIFRKVETLKNSFSYYEQNKLFESLSQKAFAGEL